MLTSKNLRLSLESAIPELKKNQNIRLQKDQPFSGMEKIIQDAIANELGQIASTQISLMEVGAQQVDGRDKGWMDIVLKNNFGIELKVVQFPRKKSTSSNALYDIGQISSDYWRIRHARNLKGGAIIILLHGELVKALGNPTSIIREFHNRMYIDYETSNLYGCLKEEKLETHRKRQIESIKLMGFDKPYHSKNGKYSIVMGCYGIINIPVPHIKLNK